MNETCVIKENKLLFDSIVNKIQESNSLEDKLKLANIALDYIWCNSSCYYASFPLEKVYIDLSKEIDCEVEDNFSSDSCLLVLTTPYKFGGHTRVVERWIEQDKKRQYSLVITKVTDGSIPDRLRFDIELSGGQIYILDENAGLVENAQKLRKLASSYESVLLFVHMYDPLPIVAFANESFKRPIGFYNHADHLFGIDYSIVDSLVEMRQWGKDLSEKHRGVCSNNTIAVPSESISVNYSKSEARKHLQIKENAKIVISAGTYFKFIPNEKGDLSFVIDEILFQDKDVYYYVIGVSDGDMPSWNYLTEKYGDRFCLLPQVSHNDLKIYLTAADLMIDSFPVSGMTTMQDSVMCGTPVLTTVTRIDWVNHTSGYCKNLNELVKNTLTLLSNESVRLDLLKHTKENLINITGYDAFATKVNLFMHDLINLKHTIHCFREIPTEIEDSDKRILSMFGNSPQAKKSKRNMKYYIKYPIFIADILCKIFSIADSFSCKLRSKLSKCTFYKFSVKSV